MCSGGTTISDSYKGTACRQPSREGMAHHFLLRRKLEYSCPRALDFLIIMLLGIANNLCYIVTIPRSRLAISPPVNSALELVELKLHPAVSHSHIHPLPRYAAGAHSRKLSASQRDELQLPVTQAHERSDASFPRCRIHLVANAPESAPAA